MKRILPTIIISQFCCTSLWFAGNAVIADIALQFHLTPHYLGYLSNAVQMGFITGTLLFAILTISDRFSPSKIFFTCAIIAAAINLGITLNHIGTFELLLFRFLTGFFLAGIYPIGMKIASDHYEKGLGKSLGFLVGALVIGTAFPHLLKSIFNGLPWKYIMISTSLLAVIGGLSMLILVPDGPFRKKSQQLKLNTFLQNFKNKDFKAAAFGYFGHQWELYTFWVFVPVILKSFNQQGHATLNVPLMSFLIIVSGSFSCAFSGLISMKIKPKSVAILCLAISGCCCLISPVVFYGNSVILLITFLVIWSMSVVADSPMFSTMVAQNATANSKGTALTIVNCIGFAITIVSIQLMTGIRTEYNTNYIFVVLAIGPLFGLIALMKNKQEAIGN